VPIVTAPPQCSKIAPAQSDAAPPLNLARFRCKIDGALTKKRRLDADSRHFIPGRKLSRRAPVSTRGAYLRQRTMARAALGKVIRGSAAGANVEIDA
jgi:hypothetical protein